jgi:hypothetical protein
MYILMSFAYVIPVSILGLFNNTIPRSNAIPSYTIMKPFFIMGCLDAISAAMQILSTVYLPVSKTVRLYKSIYKQSSHVFYVFPLAS